MYDLDQKNPTLEERTWISGNRLLNLLSNCSEASSSGLCMMSKDCFEEYKRFLHRNPNLELTLEKVADILFECQKFRAPTKPLGDNSTEHFDFEFNNNREINSMRTIRGLPSGETRPGQNPACSIQSSKHKA
ncbi:hypothetical protein PGT21_002457 [Puccinia graminis f. sp. tritici]|uniref:Uncharacterized protein n=1 Tax=Puccinia graminis f. sp. tritici TaxID=56615 RepID=A0A5B0Q5E3_PUCGR|nr:hypothetical protein PGT21_002457 [Puccinia graminis f. sp. tritici]